MRPFGKARRGSIPRRPRLDEAAPFSCLVRNPGGQDIRGMRTKVFLLVVAAHVGWGALWGCAPTETAPVLHIFDGASMGTTYAVRVVTADNWDQPRRDRIKDLIQAALDDVESKMSHYRSSSELSRFNQTRDTAPFPVSAETFDVVRHAYQLSEWTDGALDVTVGPVVNAWGFGPLEPESLPPDATLLARLRDHVGYTKLELDPGASTLRKTDPEIECDLSALAKGYGVDRVAEVLREEGLTRFMVEVGGEIFAIGLNQRGGPWRIAIERPVLEGGVQRVVPLSGHAMATSGDYRNVREVDGRLLSHTIDPRTGWPVAHQLASVSVVAELCVLADGMATGLQVLGPDDGYALAVERGWAALFLIRDDSGVITERATPAFEALLDAVTPGPAG
jgi:thiamine biosynthesis lipoprotein